MGKSHLVRQVDGGGLVHAEVKGIVYQIGTALAQSPQAVQLEFT
jgi:hypothetical protein